MRFFRISKWEIYQHYGKKRPPWIKIYTSINDSDTDWRGLQDAELGQLIRMMAYAALHENTLPFNAELIKELIECNEVINLDRLEKLGVIKVFKDKASCLSREKSRLNSRENTSGPSSEFRVQSSESKEQRKEDTSLSGKPDEVVAKKLKLRRDSVEILDFLNHITGRAFKNSKDIIACLKREKCSVDECKTVIRFKWQEWKGTDMEKFVNPTTPFRAKNFAAYLDESGATKQASKDYGGPKIQDWKKKMYDEMGIKPDESEM